MEREKCGIYMGPNGVVVQDFAAGGRGLCHNECVGKRKARFKKSKDDVPDRMYLADPQHSNEVKHG
jgi:hypothetical protein